MPSIPKNPATRGVDSPREKSWTLKSTICVARHGDRTPKCKLKFNFKGKDPWAEPFIRLLQGRTNEIILRDPEQLQYIADAAEEAQQIDGSDAEQLEQLKKIIGAKKSANGTKAQLKPAFKEDGKCDKIAIVVKWGGEFTHAARYQARDIAEQMRKDMTIMNKNLLEHTHVYSSSERRVVATAEIFMTAFLDERGVAEDAMRKLTIRKDLLDDSNAAKEEIEKVKKKLKTLCRPGSQARPEFAWPEKEVTPFETVRETIDIMNSLRATLNLNWQTLKIEDIQKRWCCGEYPYLFRERWENLFKDWCDVELDKFDPSRVSELYDSLKYDALHNRVFLEAVFTNPGGSSRPASIDSRRDEPVESSTPRQLRELYKRSKLLFDFIAPQEYGIERSEKEEIGLLTSLPLLEQVIANLRQAKENEHGSASFYFTKESHIHTLVNLVILSDLEIVMPQVPELDYMSNVTFEVYERTKADQHELAVRVSLSEGAHSAVLDASLDAKHALQVQPRRALTDYIALDKVIEILARHSKTAVEKGMQKSTTKIE